MAGGDGQPDGKHDERLSAAELLPLVYEELKRLAAARLCHERAGASRMHPTSLVHATYLRVVGEAAQDAKAWNGRPHFFGAAALAMRRILVERARQRAQLKRGGQWTRVDAELTDEGTGDMVDMLALDSALLELEGQDREMYDVVMLRYFAGLSVEESASIIGISPKTVKRRWSVARLWLLERIEGRDAGRPSAPESEA